MTERDPLGTTLDALVPPFGDDPADWDDVLRRAREPAPGAPPRRRRTLLDRALAAVSGGPVLHVVTRTNMGGTLVDLQSGSRSQVRVEQDAWFDPARGFRTTMRFGGTAIEEYGAPRDRPIRMRAATRAMQVFTRDYRDALRDGRARIVREGTVAGTPVYWIRVELSRRAPQGSPCGSLFLGRR